MIRVVIGEIGVAIVKDDMFHFSFVGSLSTFLIRNERITNIIVFMVISNINISNSLKYS